MTRNELIELINTNREIEFEYLNNRYSITYYDDDRKNYISVCRFYCTPTDVANAEEALELTIGGKTIESILVNLPEDKIDIF